MQVKKSDMKEPNLTEYKNKKACVDFRPNNQTLLAKAPFQGENR